MRRSEQKPRARVYSANSRAVASVFGTGAGRFKKGKCPACFLCFQSLAKFGTVGTVGRLCTRIYARACVVLQSHSPLVPYVYKSKGFSMFVGGTVGGTEAGPRGNNKISGVYYA